MSWDNAVLSAGNTKSVTAKSLFNAMNEKIEKVKNGITNLQKSNISLTKLKYFLNRYFKFEKGHFVSGSDAKIDFKTIFDKLVVYSMKTLDDIKKELVEVTLKGEEKLNKNYIASKAAFEVDAKNTADTLNSDTNALNAAFRTEFIEKLNGYFSNTKTDKTNTISLGKLLDGLKDYHIEIRYTAPVKSSNTFASVSAVVSDTKPASFEPYKASVSLKLADIPESKIFLPSFIIFK